MRHKNEMHWLDYFEKNYIPEPMSGCWLWIGGCDKDGYGRFRLGRTTLRAHRVSYEKFICPIPEGKYICHKCDIPSCVNPDHLWVGDASLNALDMVKKGKFRESERHIFVIRRKMSHCDHGHEFNSENTYWWPRGQSKRRQCRICYNIARRHRRQKMVAHENFMGSVR